MPLEVLDKSCGHDDRLLRDCLKCLNRLISSLVEERDSLVSDLKDAEEHAARQGQRATYIVSNIHRVLNEVGAMRRGDHPDAKERDGRIGRGTYDWRVRQLAKDRDEARVLAEEYRDGYCDCKDQKLEQDILPWEKERRNNEAEV